MKSSNIIDQVEDLIKKQREIANRYVYSKFDGERRISAMEKLSMLEPIFNVLKQLQDRIDVLEGKNKQ